MTNSSPVRILDKTLAILLLFDENTPDWGVTAISRAVGMPKSTVYRILSSLEHHGFLAQDPRTKHFRLGLTILELGRRAYEAIDVRRIAAPVLNALSERTGETALLSVVSPAGDRVVCIERSQQRSGLRLTLEVASTAPLHVGASSKVLMAYLTPEAIEGVIRGGLPAYTPHTITDPDTLRIELATIRQRGYAKSFEESDLGAGAVAVPIHDYLGRVVAGLTLAGPVTRVNDDALESYLDATRAAALEIEEQLGYHNPEAQGDSAAG